MSNKYDKYQVPTIKRPKIVATKKLDLSTKEGQQIIKSETKLVLQTHRETFKRLADM